MTKKRKINRTRSWHVLIALALCLAPLAALAGTYGDLTYTSDGSAITITDCASSAVDVAIPDTIESLPVTSIGNNAFAYCNSLTNVTIPSSVTGIGTGGFRNCTSLDTIAIPGSVTSIGDYAFYYCTSLTNITIPASVTSIGNVAFGICSSLPAITIPSSTASIGNDPFRHCNSLANISVDPANAYYSSHDGVLYNKDQTLLLLCPDGKTGSYAIPGTATNIETRAFQHTSLTNVIIPDSVDVIGDWAFEWSTNLTVISVDPANTTFSSLNGVLFNKGQTALIQYPGGKTNSTYTIPDGVFSIGPGAFTFSQNLSDIVIADTVTNIAIWAFHDSYGLTSIIIPDSVTAIDKAAFWNCTGLTNVVLGQNLVSMGIDNTVFAGVFESCTNLTSIVIPASVTNIGHNTFAYCNNLTSITIADGVTSIGAGAFAYCTSLASITIPNSVTSIGYAAFRNCTSLSSITIPESVTSIGDYAFRDCTSLTSVYFEGDAFYVSTSVFYNANSVTVYYLPGTSGWGATVGGRPAVLWNPVMQLGAGYGATTNGFSFNISGTADIPIAVEACTNLPEGAWTPLYSGALSGGSMDFSDPDWTNFPSRLYRIATP